MNTAQVLAGVRIYLHVENELRQDLEQVRCLNCRHVYDKPANGGAEGRSLGCPDCGYVGWLSVLVPYSEPARPIASA